MTNARRIWLTRHGESIYNQKALIGGDSSLSPNGAAYAEVLPEVILSRLPKVRQCGLQETQCACRKQATACRAAAGMLRVACSQAGYLNMIAAGRKTAAAVLSGWEWCGTAYQQLASTVLFYH
jgi:hypothetical protein